MLSQERVQNFDTHHPLETKESFGLRRREAKARRFLVFRADPLQ